jgi:hypothetical protein
MVAKGSAVVVVKGVKVPLGTRGTAFWVGETKFGMRVGLKDAAGTVYWTAMGNVESAAPVSYPTAAATGEYGPAVAGAVAATAAVAAEARIAALEARVAALEAALAPAPAKPPMPLGDYGNAMEYRLVLDEMAASGNAAALAELTALDAAIAAAA